MKLAKITFYILSSLVLLGAVWYSVPITKQDPSIAAIGNKVVVSLLVADTKNEREAGLSGYQELPEKTGMLFIFDEPSRYSFWMMGMTFSLDFIWIEDGVVRDLTEDVSYRDQLQIIRPSVPVRKVLELPAGFVSEYGIEVGDKVVIQ